MSTDTKRPIVSSAIIVMTSMVVSRVTGFLRQTLLSNMIKDDLARDGYLLAFTITDFMYYLLIGGAISSALIPVLSDYISKKKEKSAWKGISTFVNVLFFAMVISCILGMIFSNTVLNFVAPNFAPGQPQYRELAAKVIRILFPSVTFMMLTGFLNGVLNSHHKFAAAAYGPSIYNLGCCVSIFFFSSKGVDTVAVGVMFSSLIYFLMQLGFTLKYLKYYRFIIDLKNAVSKKLFALAFPTLLSSAVTQLNSVIIKSLISGFAAGGITANDNANMLWQLPYGIIAMGIGTAMLPSLSETHALQDTKRFYGLLTKALNYVSFLALPAAVAFLILGREVVSLVFKWSGAVDVSTTGTILTVYAMCIFFQSVIYILYRAFYAAKNTKIPFYLAAFTITVTITFAIIFKNFTTLDIYGICLAYLISSILSYILALYLVNRIVIKINIKNICQNLIKTAAAAFIMGLILIFIRRLIPVDVTNIFSMPGKIKDLIFFIIYVITGGLAYFIICLILGVREALTTIDAIWNKFAKFTKKE